MFHASAAARGPIRWFVSSGSGCPTRKRQLVPDRAVDLTAIAFDAVSSFRQPATPQCDLLHLPLDCSPNHTALRCRL